MDDYTATLNGVTIGSGTVYQWTAWPTGLGVPEIRAEDEFRPRRDGITPGDDWLGARTVVFEVQVKGEHADIEEALSDLSAAFAPRSSDVWLDLRVTGSPSEYALKGRPRGCVWDLQKRFTHGIGDARCVFVATDPLKYGPEQTVVISLGAGGAGLAYPVSYPISYGASSLTGLASTPNVGLKAVEWSAEIAGPVTNPRVAHVETGLYVAVDATLESGQTIVLDSRAGALLLGGTTPRPNWLRPGSRWFTLAAGSNSLRYTADSGSGAATITYRPGWV